MASNRSTPNIPRLERVKVPTETERRAQWKRIRKVIRMGSIYLIESKYTIDNLDVSDINQIKSQDNHRVSRTKVSIYLRNISQVRNSNKMLSPITCHTHQGNHHKLQSDKYYSRNKISIQYRNKLFIMLLHLLLHFKQNNHNKAEKQDGKTWGLPVNPEGTFALLGTWNDPRLSLKA